MKRKRLFFVIALFLAVILIGSGLFRVFRVYQHYRADILLNESRHLGSIVAANTSGLDWMLRGYDGQLGMLTERWEFSAAEARYSETKDPSVMSMFMQRKDIVRPDMRYCIAVWDGDVLIGVSDIQFPSVRADDESLGSLCSVRRDSLGQYWFIFTRVKDNGLQYELAVQVQTIFSYQAESSRVGNAGFLFLLDRECRFVAYTGAGLYDIVSVDELLQVRPELSHEVFNRILQPMPNGYMVCRFPWAQGTEETLVVAAPLFTGADGLLVGAAMSFSEFNSFLSDTLREIAWIILLEIGGALILVFMAGWVMVQNRRSALELSAVKERADLMEEINRQQQSLYHTERLQQLGVMTSGIVHEFNNLLTPIMGQSMLLLEEIADRDGTQEFEYALDVYEASEKARDILRRMSSMGKKDVDLGFRVLDLGLLLNKTVNMSAMAKDPHISQELELPQEPLFVEGNEHLLTQAFLNLFINGCQAMEGKGVLTVSAEDETISGRPYAVVRVSDTGPGIPEDNMGSIYDSFFTTKGEQGTGLGLSICKKIIESHKGTIQAANLTTGGAQFTVKIPIVNIPEE